MPPLPPLAAPAWAVFAALHAKRRSGMAAPEGIAHTEVLAWQRLHGVQLSAWELQAIDQLDAVFLRYAADQAEQHRRRPTSKG